MLGLFLLICIYLVLGFFLAWIAGVVAREDVEVKTGAIILFVTGVLSVLARLGLKESMPEAIPWLMPIIQFGILIVLLHLIARLSMKHSAIIAAIYTGLLFLVGLALA